MSDSPKQTGESSLNPHNVDATKPPTPPGMVMKKKARFDDGKLVYYWEPQKIEVPVEKKPPPKLKDFEKFDLDEDISVGSIFPSLKNTPFDAVTLKKTSIVFIGRKINEFKPAGLWFETDVEFRGILEPIADGLREYFGQKQPAIHLSAHLGLERELDDSLVGNGFTFRGSIEGIFTNFGPMVQFRSAGIEIAIDQNHKMSWGFVGALNLNVPNAVVPLVLQYELTPDTDSCKLSMGLKKDDLWRDVFGVSGLDLAFVIFTATFPKKNFTKNLSFTLAVKWVFKGLNIELSGTFSNSEAYLRGTARSFTLQNIRDIFESMTGCELDPIDQDIMIDEVTIEISKGSLNLYGEVSMDGHKAAAAKVTISTSGVSITGAVADIDIGEGISIKQASIQLVVGSSTPSEHNKTVEGGQKEELPSDEPLSPPVLDAPATTQKSGRRVAGLIKGVVVFKDITFNVALATYKPSGGNLEWVVYGEVDSPTLKIGELVGELEGSPLDVILKRVTLIASSSDNPNVPELNVCQYPIKEGIQVCAQLESMPYVAEVTNCKESSDVFVLRAGYSKKDGLTVVIRLPDDMRINIGPNVTSGPLLLEIVTNPEPSVKFAAVLWARIDENAKPLQFTLGLVADAIEAKGFATMEGYWNNPLGISPRIKLGPIMTVQVGINYAQFLSTGTPSAIGFEASIVVDETKSYNAALYVSENPKETLIKGHIAELDIADVIQFVNAMISHEVPSPREDILRFEDVDLYASQCGCTLGTQIYPAGFVFQGTMYLCGRRASMDCRIGREGLKLNGSIQGFSLGPLTITGAVGDEAVVDIEISKETQHIYMNGMISLWGLSTKVFVLAELQPHPQFEFDFELAWSDLLKFGVHAKMLNPSSDLTKMEHADFLLQATMEQRILAAVADQMQHFFDQAHHSAKEGIANARQSVIDAKIEFDKKVEEAKAVVEKERIAFNKRVAQAEAALKEREEECTRKRLQLQDNVRTAENEAEGLAASANKKLDQKQLEMDVAIKQAQVNLADTQREADRKIESALYTLQEKRIDLQNGFGNVTNALKRAEESVHHERWRVSDVEQRLNNRREACERAVIFKKPAIWFEIGVLEAERAFLIFELTAAELILSAARAIVEGPLYSAAMTTVDIACGAVELARQTGAGLISVAQRILDGIPALHQKFIDAAKLAIIVAKEAGKALINSAQFAYDTALLAEREILVAAREMVVAAAKGIEFVTFQAALVVLDAVQKNTTLVDIAQKALDIAEKAEELAFAAASWLTNQIRAGLNIESIELTGTLRSIVGDGPGFTIKVKGTVLGHRIDFVGTWSPANALAYLISMCEELWEMLKREMLPMFSNILCLDEGSKEEDNRIQLLE